MDSDDLDRTNERIDLLIKLSEADVFDRLVRNVIQGMDADDRAMFTEQIQKRAQARIDALTDAEVDRLVRGWIEPQARTAINATWSANVKDIAGKVQAAVGRYLTDANIDAIVAQNVPTALTALVRDYVQKLRTAIRA